MPTIESEAHELLLSSKDARLNGNYVNPIKDVQSMPEVSIALKLILEQFGQNPAKVLGHSFLLGLYIGLQYHDVNKILGE